MAAEIYKNDWRGATAVPLSGSVVERQEGRAGIGGSMARGGFSAKKSWHGCWARLAEKLTAMPEFWWKLLGAGWSRAALREGRAG